MELATLNNVFRIICKIIQTVSCSFLIGTFGAQLTFWYCTLPKACHSVYSITA